MKLGGFILTLNDIHRAMLSANEICHKLNAQPQKMNGITRSVTRSDGFLL